MCTFLVETLVFLAGIVWGLQSVRGPPFPKLEDADSSLLSTQHTNHLCREHDVRYLDGSKYRGAAPGARLKLEAVSAGVLAYVGLAGQDPSLTARK